ncbi:MAG: DNA gyrase subunit A, partial [Clostridiales bacterium]|nr:DNA gyrase subunit A [Clostridiales bacterium]
SVEEMAEKKKGAGGVRGMKLAVDDLLTAVYYLVSGDESAIEYNGKMLELSKLKAGRRDGKGVKIRVT